MAALALSRLKAAVSVFAVSLLHELKKAARITTPKNFTKECFIFN
jgi:hypothetical protein